MRASGGCERRPSGAKEIDLRTQRDKRDATIRVLKGHRTRLKRRLANGVCPVPGCKRSFSDHAMVRHLATVHPDFTKTDIG